LAYRCAVPLLQRVLAAVCIAVFAQAALAPCPVGSVPEAEPHAAFSAHAHHGDGAHDAHSSHPTGPRDDEGEQVGRPCPCGCGGESPAVAPGIVVGHALIAATPEVPPLARAALIPIASAHVPVAPVASDDAVPRKA
jgi:hypothetical protein